LSEIPDSSYDVVVFENRFPSLAGDSGRCEVVCFTSDHDASFADLSERQARLVLDAWTDRTAELSHLD
ncbi:galactose-1-phosphate uridylyltransferase, partial [Streptomyces sp. SID10244]|nr:galactose-1-phosphate uridylyltransferase [Streptomyces sp. SID10244]